MAGIADFLDSLVGGFDLICYSLIIGGLFYLAALVVVARTASAEVAVPEAAPGRVVLGH